MALINAEVKKGVYLSSGVSVMALLFVGIVMIYPPLLDNVEPLLFCFLKTWWLLVALGGLCFIFNNRLNVGYLIWTNIITLFALSYNVLMINIVVSFYGIAEWTYSISMLALVFFSLYQLVIRFRTGGYIESTKKQRVIPGTFYFHPDKHVSLSLNGGRFDSFYDWAGKATAGLVGLSGGMGAVIQGTPMLGGFYVIALSIFSLLFSWFLFKVFLPDLIFCIFAGLDGINKDSHNK
jgi:hypothetical protein